VTSVLTRVAHLAIVVTLGKVVLCLPDKEGRHDREASLVVPVDIPRLELSASRMESVAWWLVDVGGEHLEAPSSSRVSAALQKWSDSYSA
jgi:hypothetical protein